MRHGMEYVQSPEKRAFDIAGAALLGGAQAPFMPLFGIGAALLARELAVGIPELLFRQERLGRSGATFKALKFRTIPPENESHHTFGTHDERARRIGRLIRASGIDEIPQLINVLRGEMSLVGPRPMVAVDFSHYQDADPWLFKDWETMYYETRPGIFGISQLMRRGVRDVTPQVRRDSMWSDLQYATQDASPAVDAAIMLATVPASIALALRVRRQRPLPNG